MEEIEHQKSKNDSILTMNDYIIYVFNGRKKVGKINYENKYEGSFPFFTHIMTKLTKTITILRTIL